MKQLSIHLSLLLVIAGGIFFTNLGGASLWDRDEPRNAGCANEMMLRGDWVVPTFNDELRYQKPVLLYWFMMSAYALFDVGEFAARFWSAVLGVGTVLLTWGIGRRLFHPTVGLLAGILLASSLMFDVAARAATPDSVLIFFSTLAIYLYVIGTFVRVEDEEGDESFVDLRDEDCWFPRRWWMAALIYAAMSVAVLAKGPVGIVLPCAIIGMFLLIMRLPALDKQSWKVQGWLGKLVISCFRPFHPWHFLKTCWSMQLWMAVLMLALIAAPWYVLVGMRTDWDFTRIFFLSENFGRATTPFENHAGGWWYYPVTLLIGFFPWSVFWIPTALSVDRELTHRRDASFPLIFLLCWVGVQVVLFSLASTKLPSYVTPCYPALALLTGWALTRWATGESRISERWFGWAQLSCVLSGLLLMAGLVYLCAKVLGGSWWLPGLAAIPIFSGLAGWWFTRQEQPRQAVTAAVVGGVLFCFGLFGFGTQAVSGYQTGPDFFQVLKNQDLPIPVATYRCMESSWVVYANRPIFELAQAAPSGEEFFHRENWWDPKPRVTPETFVNTYGSAIFITTDEHVEELQRRLPPGYQVVQQTRYFLRDRQLLMLADPTRVALFANPAQTPEETPIQR